jgi:hypothetical protein
LRRIERAVHSFYTKERDHPSRQIKCVASIGVARGDFHARFMPSDEPAADNDKFTENEFCMS